MEPVASPVAKSGAPRPASVSDNIWANAVPEAIGGGSVAVVLLFVEWVRERWRHSAKISKARAAADSELQSLRSVAAALSEGRDADSRPGRLDAGPLTSLIRLGMERIGDLDTEAALARVRGGVEVCNGHSETLAREASSVGRAMGDHAAVVAGLVVAQKDAAKCLVRMIDELGESLHRG